MFQFQRLQKCLQIYSNNFKFTLDFYNIFIYNSQVSWRDGWAGRRRTIGNRVSANTTSGVRIPFSPPKNPSLRTWIFLSIAKAMVYHRRKAYIITQSVYIISRRLYFLSQWWYTIPSELMIYKTSSWWYARLRRDLRKSLNSYAKLPKISFSTKSTLIGG